MRKIRLCAYKNMDVCTSLMTVCHVAYLLSSMLQLAQTRPTMVKQLRTSLLHPYATTHSLYTLGNVTCLLDVVPSNRLPNPSAYFMLFAKQHPTTIYECSSKFCMHAALLILYPCLHHLHCSCVPGPKSVI